MLVCPLCPGRLFTDDNAIRMHWESKHVHSCGWCSKEFSSQEALDQHTRDKHPPIKCQYCSREFATDAGRLAHEMAKHPPMFECDHCDCEFTTDEGRLAHEKAKHAPKFECEYCDSEFTTDEGRLAHQKAKHRPMFECRYCDRELTTLYGRNAHEEAKHSMFECRHCDRILKSRETRQQHEDTKHNFKCNLCSTNFTEAEALRQHEQTTLHFECSYCTEKHFTTTLKRAHEMTCAFNPVNRVVHSTLVPSDWPSSESTENVEEELSASDEGSESSSCSSQDEEGVFHLTSVLSPTNTNDEGTTVTQPCACADSLEPDTCTICQPSSTDKLVPDDAESVVSANEDHQDDSLAHREAVFQCTPCLKLFETEETLGNHVCTFRKIMLRPHCPICYTQFDNGALLQEHLEDPQSFSCQLCLTRCCSDEMLQDHLLGHPTCSKCGKLFIDNIALCTHVESDHPVVVCWDCNGVVVETNSLELHFTDSPVHPSCRFCGVGKRNSADMDEHIRHVHATGVEMEDQPRGGNASPEEGSPLAETQPPRADREETVQPPAKEVDRVPLSSGVEIGGPLGGPGDESHSSPVQTELSLYSTPLPLMSPQVERVDETAGDPSVVNGEETMDVGPRQYASPSPTPSEHGSGTSRLQLHASNVTDTATNNDTRLPSLVSSGSARSLSDPSTRSSPTSSASNSVVFVSADGIPEYIRENCAILVATSAGSRSSGRTPLRLSSSSSLDSLDVATREARSEDDPTAPKTAGSAPVMLRLHCRICLRDPCENMTATICGHIFCKRCITQTIVAKSECPVCESATLLYCLFKLDLSV